MKRKNEDTSKKSPVFAVKPERGLYTLRVRFFDPILEEFNCVWITTRDGATAVLTKEEVEAKIKEILHVFKVAQLASTKATTGDEVTVDDFPVVWESGD